MTEPIEGMPAAEPGAINSRSEFIDGLMDTELYSIGAYFCDQHPELVDEVVTVSAEIESVGIERYAEVSEMTIEDTFGALLTGLAVRYYNAVAG